MRGALGEGASNYPSAWDSDLHLLGFETKLSGSTDDCLNRHYIADPRRKFPASARLMQIFLHFLELVVSVRLERFASLGAFGAGREHLGSWPRLGFWGTWIRTKTNRVRADCSTVKLSPKAGANACEGVI